MVSIPDIQMEGNLRMIQVYLWDIDGTLLDFGLAEKAAIRACFIRFGLGECPDDMLARYSSINQKYWNALERGELTKPQVLSGRFQEFFQSEGIEFSDIEGFNHAYQIQLGETVVFRDHGYELVRDLKGQVRQYAVTNGTAVAQQRKLDKSGLIRLLDGVFISEQVGAEKPSPDFFRAVFNHVGPIAPEEVLIVGDSLTSDIQGGNNAGILCCWYDPEDRPLPQGLTVHYHIQDLNQVREILTLSL